MTHSRASAPDLEHTYPRGPRETLGGMMMLPRAIDKARATLAGTLGDYTYFNCPLNRVLFHVLGVKDAQFLAAVEAANDDAGVLAWIEAEHRPTAERIAAMNAQIVRFAPLSPEAKEHFYLALRATHTTRTDIATWVDLIDLEEGRLA
jgi:hypothetical protein